MAAMNINAVARRARVSTATVSRVINGSAIVAPATEKRVRAAIEALNFYPDINARALGSGRSHLYGLIISDITNPYFPELVKIFEDLAVAHGQEVLVANTNYDPARMESCVTRMLQRRVDGVAILTSEMDDHLVRTLLHRKIPIVVYDTEFNIPGVRTVRVDYERGVHEAVDYLVKLGHRDLAFLAGPPQLSSARTRARAFREALERHRLPLREEWMGQGDHRAEGGHRAMRELLRAKGARPTAVLGSNDLTAIGAMGALREAGLRIPHDISVVGFDGIEISAYMEPALTTMTVPRAELATVAFRSLFRERGSETTLDPDRSVAIILPTLTPRASTAAPAARTGAKRQRS